MVTPKPKSPYDPLAAQPIGGGMDRTTPVAPQPFDRTTPMPQAQPMPAQPPAQPAAPAQPAVQPAQPVQPTAGVAGPQALQRAQQAAQTRLGRQLTQQEIEVLRSQPGVSNPDGTFNIDAALGLINKYSGDLANPWGAPAAAATPTPSVGNVDEEYRRQLMALLKGEVPVSLDQNNPALQAERAAFDRANQRATTRQRLSAAERRAADNTLGAGGFDADIAGIEQGAGDRSVGFESELFRNERQGQIDRLMQALGMAQGYGATQQGLGLQGQLGKGQLALGYLNAMLGDKQAGNSLGFNYAALQNQMNNQALQALLAGL